MVAAVEMERWRSYFGKSGVDIWTVIQQAISVAALDYPKDFRERRAEIAETLFARSLVMMHARDVKDDPELIISEDCELRDGDTQPRHMLKRPPHDADDDDATHMQINVIRGDDDTSHEHLCVIRADDDYAAHPQGYHEDAETFSDELDKETLIIRELDGIKAAIAGDDQPENVILEVLQRLQCMQITVGALKATEIGKQVKCLKKHSSKRVRAVVKELVRHWKVLVDEWVSSERDVVVAAATGAADTDYGDCPEAGNEEDGLSSPPLEDEVEVLDARAPSVDLSQLFSFVDGEICTGNKDGCKPSNSVEPSVKDNLKYLSRSQSGSMLTDSSDFDTKASTNHPWGHRTPEERGSATRDKYPSSCKFEKNESALKGQIGQRDRAAKGSNNEWVLPVSKGITNDSGAGRLCNEVSKVKPMSGGKPTSDNGVSRSHIVHKTVTSHMSSGDKLSIMKSDKNLVDQKLEIAKRKLHQGYQQAENAKKQRTVQVLSFPDLPKAAQLVKGKVNPPVQNKVIPPAQNRAGFQSGHGSQNRR